MKSFEYAEAHLVNVRQEIQRLTQNGEQIASEIERMRKFVEQAEQDIAEEKARHASAIVAAGDTSTSTTLPVF